MKKETENNTLPNGTRVRDKIDGAIGVVERIGHRFGDGRDAYYVRWENGKLGFPNEDDLEVIG